MWPCSDWILRWRRCRNLTLLRLLASQTKGKGSSSNASVVSTQHSRTIFPHFQLHQPRPTVGRFVRKPKEDTPDYKILGARKETDKENNDGLLAQYEYDDEYDDLGLSVVESLPKKVKRLVVTELAQDGKNYSYKVAGAVAAANANEAEGDKIFGLGRGGNIPLGGGEKAGIVSGTDR